MKIFLHSNFHRFDLILRFEFHVDLFVIEGDKSKVCKVLQMAWTFVNDR